MLLSASIYLLLALSILFSAERRHNLQRMQLAQSPVRTASVERTDSGLAAGEPSTERYSG